MVTRSVRLSVVLLVLAALPCLAAAPITGRTWTIGWGQDTIQVIEVWGTPYQMGYAHGRLVRADLAAYYERFLSTIMGQLGVKGEDLDAAWEQMSPYIAPEFKEEMRGLADGAGVSLRQVRWMHVIADVSWLPPLHYQCSSFAAWGKAVPDGHLYQMRALDYWMDAHVQDKPALILYRPDRGYPFVNVAWIGYLGVVTGMNSQGIALSEIGDDFGPEHERMNAEPWLFTARRMMQYTASLDEAVALVRNARRISSYDYLIGDGRRRQARQLCTAADIFREYGWQEPPHKAAPLEDVIYLSMSVLRDDYNRRMRERLAADYGHITYRTACYDAMPVIETGCLHAVAMDATDLVLWVANAEGPEGPAYNRPYIRFDLAAALRRPVGTR